MKSLNGKLDLRTDQGISATLEGMMGSGTTSFGAAIKNIDDELATDISPERRQNLEKVKAAYKEGLGKLSIDNAVSDIAAMQYWQMADPEGYSSSARREEVRQMLADLRKLRERRHQAIRMHNQLNTVEGEKDFNKGVEYYTQAYKEQQAQEGRGANGRSC